MTGEPWDPVERDRHYASGKRAGLRRLMSEGDSWFDYPPHPNVIDWLDGEGIWTIKRFEKSGDTVANIASEANLARLAKTARDEKPEAILFSGGGNDLFTDIVEKPNLRWIWRALMPFDPAKTPAEHLNQDEWGPKKKEIKDGIVRVIAALGGYAPILIHGYDNLVASGARVKYDGFRVAGPWILPSMHDRGIDDTDFQRGILKALIKEYNDMLAGIAGDHPDTVIHVNLVGTLNPDRDWLNEIHPTEEGFHKVERKFLDALRNDLPVVQQRRHG